MITPLRLFGEHDGKQFAPQINPDNDGPWAVRYLWVQHREDNDAFCKNYFTPDLAEAGLNIRKQTAELQTDWNAHNQIFYDSAKNGDLVWRVKVGNIDDNSIDYIEIWKSPEILEHYFGHQTSIPGWTTDSRKSFLGNLYEAGFDLREWEPYPTISKIQAMTYYKTFVERWRQRQKCIINTPWNKDLNPI